MLHTVCLVNWWLSGWRCQLVYSGNFDKWTESSAQSVPSICYLYTRYVHPSLCLDAAAAAATDNDDGHTTSPQAGIRSSWDLNCNCTFRTLDKRGAEKKKSQFYCRTTFSFPSRFKITKFKSLIKLIFFCINYMGIFSGGGFWLSIYYHYPPLLYLRHNNHNSA